MRRLLGNMSFGIHDRIKKHHSRIVNFSRIVSANASHYLRSLYRETDQASQKLHARYRDIEQYHDCYVKHQ